MIASLLGVNRGAIPPTINCDEPDPDLGQIDLVRGSPRSTDRPTFVNTNLTRHGQAAAVVVRGNPLPR
jgi:3-oxoacyl-[acyl-carrier-protein] synthase II